MKIKHPAILAYIAIGSNLDNPVYQVRSALKSLHNITKSRINKISKLYQTPPLGPSGQQDYINAVISLETQLNAHDLLTELWRIENEHGRIRTTKRWDSRVLDLDLILFDNLSINTPQLTVPHPEFHKRAFVLVPLSDIAPDLVVPSGKKLSELIDALPESKLSPIRDPL